MHPVGLARALIIVCLLERALLIKIRYSWLFYVLVLIFLGGVIVVLAYIASLAGNDKVFYNPLKLGVVCPLIVLALCFFDEASFAKISSAERLASPLFEPALFYTLVLCFLTLLLALVRVVKLLKLEAGPLVKRLLRFNLYKIYACQA